jgi:hypothetical protein
MVEPLYKGKFNNSVTKPASPKKKHRIIEYRVKDDCVLCTCAFEGTAEEFDKHNIGKRRSLYSLKEIALNSFDYYCQGSTGYYRPKEDSCYE